jgi:Ni,Fe-hydrogenase III large subunit
LLLELERVYSHLGDLAGMCVDVAYPVGARHSLYCARKSSAKTRR